MSKLSKIICIVLMGFYALYINAALTNFFRYGHSLESILATLPLNVLTIGYAITTLVFLSSKNRAINFAIFSAPIVIVLVSMQCNRESFGFDLPALTRHHVKEVDFREINFRGKPLKYTLRMQDPWGEDHREFIVIEYENRQEIPVNLFDHPLGGYGDDSSTIPWLLPKIVSSDVLEMQINAYFMKKNKYRLEFVHGKFIVIDTMLGGRE